MSREISVVLDGSNVAFWRGRFGCFIEGRKRDEEDIFLALS
jgi:hypothetical protein